MKLVLFGGLIFIGGTIMFSASFISIAVDKAVLGGLGPLCMVIGIALGIIGLILKDRKQKGD